MLSLASLIGEAVLHDDAKRLSGNVADLDVLLQEDSLRVFEREHGGVFAFLAFHPVADEAVAAYVAEGTLAFDSGPTILVLFTSASHADSPRAVTRTALGSGLVVESAALPAQHMTRALFTTKAAPPLPGLLVFDSFTTPGEALYFDLTGRDTSADVREALRQIFSLVSHAARNRATKRNFADLLAVVAQRQRIDHVRSGTVSMRQWLVQAYQFVGKHSADIAGALGLS